LKSYIYNTATFVLLDTDAKYCNPEGADKRHGTLVLFNTIVYTIHPIEKPTLYTISQIQKVLLIHEGQKVRRINTSNFNNIANLIINAIENTRARNNVLNVPDHGDRQSRLFSDQIKIWPIRNVFV
jgi:hypothetical protein